jgi:signal transduction histidine kinase/ActR/RegA family two-component response regulator
MSQDRDPVLSSSLKADAFLPQGERADLDIPDFCDMHRFDQMMKDWAEATGLATVAVGRDGRYISGCYNFTDFCSKLTRGSPEGLRRCVECDRKGHGVYLCHSGLVDFASPITLDDGTVLGTIIGGQVLPEKPKEEAFRKTAKELGIDEDEYIQALHQVNIRSREEIQASFDLLSNVINFFVRASYASRLNTESLLERAHIIASLGKVYFCDYFIDLVNGDFQELDAPEEIRTVIGESGKASYLLKECCPLLVEEPFVPEALAFVDLSTLRERLCQRDTVSFEFIEKGKEWRRANFIAVRRNKKGEVTQVLFAVQNIQEEKIKELSDRKKLEKAVEDANRANRAKSDFLSRMSHDIRTPLNGIFGMTYLASLEDNPPKTKDYLSKIDTSSKFLLGLINDILDMSKVESNRVVLHPEPYLPSEFNRYLDSVIRPLCAEKNLCFTVSEELVPGRVPLLDKLRINQVIFNLLSNAVKFTPEGGKVTYAAKFTPIPDSTRLHLAFQVRDNGVGMSEDFQKILFTPFSQEGRVDNDQNRGSGLGLAIAKHMVELMGGTITVHSELGKGTEFMVMMDIDSIDEKEAKKKEETKTSGKESPVSSLKGKHILVFEDHPLNQEIVKNLLERKAAQVEIAENGQRGLEMFEDSPVGFYDLILMDIRMPVMDGFEATYALRNLSRTDSKKIPIIAMTADAFAEEIHKCLEIGMNGHIAKPIDPEQLYQLLDETLAK